MRKKKDPEIASIQCTDCNTTFINKGRDDKELMSIFNAHVLWEHFTEAKGRKKTIN